MTTIWTCTLSPRCTLDLLTFLIPTPAAYSSDPPHLRCIIYILHAHLRSLP